MSGPGHEIDPEGIEAAVRSGHEEDAVSSRILRRSVLAFVVIVLVAVSAVYVLQPLMVRSQQAQSPPANPLAAAYGRVDPPAPRLQVDPALDIFQHRQNEQRVLTSYGWVDEQAGVVRIPIERAIALIAERGLPPTMGRGAAEAPPPAAGAQP